MSKFTVRVELYETGTDSEKIYNNLHEAMKTNDFFRGIIQGGKKFKLPPAEYVSNHNLTPSKVLELVKNTVKPIWKDFGVFITPTDIDWEHWNLKSND